jgi:hypothetical protein
MKPAHVVLLVLGLAAIGLIAFVAGRGCGGETEAEFPTPETGGAVPGIPGPKEKTTTAKQPEARQPAPRTGEQPAERGQESLPSPVPGKKTRQPRPGPTVQPKATVQEEPRVYENDELGVAVAKPPGEAWKMTAKKSNFHGVVRPHKVLEMRRSPTSGGGFAHVELFVAHIPREQTADSIAKSFERHEDITKWAEEGRFTVLDEREVEVGGRTMLRRTIEVNFRKRKIRLLSLRAVRRGKLYMLLAMTDPEHFDAVAPELEQIVKSLELD